MNERAPWSLFKQGGAASEAAAKVFNQAYMNLDYHLISFKQDHCEIFLSINH